MLLKDWLSRLDSIQRELERLLPVNRLHVAFSLKIGSCGGNSAELGTFPFGTALWMTMVAADKYEDPETEDLWFGPGRDQFPLVICWSEEEGLTLHDSMPPGFFPKGDDGPYLRESLGWCRWYYVKDEDGPSETDRKGFGLRIAEIEEAILEACDHAPQAVLDRVGNLSMLGCWPTALLYLAMKRIHPLLFADGDDVPKGGKGHWVEVDEGLRRWEQDKESEEGNSWTDLNDRVIMLYPDVRTATAHAFDALRHIAQSGSTVSSGAGQGGTPEIGEHSRGAGLALADVLDDFGMQFRKVQEKLERLWVMQPEEHSIDDARRLALGSVALRESNRLLRYSKTRVEEALQEAEKCLYQVLGPTESRSLREQLTAVLESVTELDLAATQITGEMFPSESKVNRMEAAYRVQDATKAAIGQKLEAIHGLSRRIRQLIGAQAPIGSGEAASPGLATVIRLHLRAFRDLLPRASDIHMESLRVPEGDDTNRYWDAIFDGRSVSFPEGLDCHVDAVATTDATAVHDVNGWVDDEGKLVTYAVSGGKLAAFPELQRACVAAAKGLLLIQEPSQVPRAREMPAKWQRLVSLLDKRETGAVDVRPMFCHWFEFLFKAAGEPGCGLAATSSQSSWPGLPPTEHRTLEGGLCEASITALEYLYTLVAKDVPPTEAAAKPPPAISAEPGVPPEQESYYLFASIPDGMTDFAGVRLGESGTRVFCAVEGKQKAEALCRLFTKEHGTGTAARPSDNAPKPEFSFRRAADLPMEDRVLHDEALQWVNTYTADADPYTYEPPARKIDMLLAAYMRRAMSWESMLAAELGALVKDETRMGEPGSSPSPPPESRPNDPDGQGGHGQPPASPTRLESTETSGRSPAIFDPRRAVWERERLEDEREARAWVEETQAEIAKLVDEHDARPRFAEMVCAWDQEQTSNAATGEAVAMLFTAGEHRQATVAEKYACLAAIHDAALGVPPLSPLRFVYRSPSPWLGQDLDERHKNGEKVHLHTLRPRNLHPDYQLAVRYLLEEIEKDLSEIARSHGGSGEAVGSQADEEETASTPGGGQRRKGSGPRVEVPVVQLSGKGQSCQVLGKPKPAVTDAQYDVVQALLQAGEQGLTKDALEAVRPSARRALRWLADGDSDWKSVVSFPTSPGVGYRIRRPT